MEKLNGAAKIVIWVLSIGWLWLLILPVLAVKLNIKIDEQLVTDRGQILTALVGMLAATKSGNSGLSMDDIRNIIIKVMDERTGQTKSSVTIEGKDKQNEG